MRSDLVIISGGSPRFAKPLPVGQLYYPSWSRYKAAMTDIFERRYYTNHGPLVQTLESELSKFLGVRHAICVTNATVGLMMVADALGLRGTVVLPSHTFIATGLSLRWCGLEPLFCDVNPETQQIDAKSIERLGSKSISAILAVNLWGGACDLDALQQLADQMRVCLYFDSCHSFGSKVRDTFIGNFGRAEVFSFHATKVVSAGEGGCITTNDDEIAAKVRNIRSSYGAGEYVQVLRTANGRMSEAQAAVALMSLKDFPVIQARNRWLFEAYDKGLADIPGISLFQPANVSFTNYQYAVCTIDKEEFGLNRDQLLQILHAENVIARRYFFPGLHQSVGFISPSPPVLPVTESLCSNGIQLPLGFRVDERDVVTICELIYRAHEASEKLAHIVPRSI